MNRKEKTIRIEDTFHGKEVWLDSTEEWQFYCWVLEACKYKIVQDFQYQPDSFELTPKYDYVPLFQTKKKEQCLFRPHIYTADFRLVVPFSWGEKLSSLGMKLMNESVLPDGNLEIYIDTKGSYDKNSRKFSINQKFVWLQHKKYIQKVVPKDFFKKFGCPDRCRFTMKSKKDCHLFDDSPSMRNVFLETQGQSPQT